MVEQGSVLFPFSARSKMWGFLLLVMLVVLIL